MAGTTKRSGEGVAGIEICLQPGCDFPPWTGSPFCFQHLFAAVDTVLPSKDRAKFWDGLFAIIRTLTYREREVLKLRYGWGDGNKYSLEEVGRIFKVPRERVREIEAVGVRKFQHPVRARALKNLCRDTFDSYDFGKRASEMPGILLQAVVVPGSKTDEGQLIEAVKFPWYMILKWIEKDPTVVYQIWTFASQGPLRPRDLHSFSASRLVSGVR